MHSEYMSSTATNVGKPHVFNSYLRHLSPRVHCHASFSIFSALLGNRSPNCVDCRIIHLSPIENLLSVMLENKRSTIKFSWHNFDIEHRASAFDCLWQSSTWIPMLQARHSSLFVDRPHAACTIFELHRHVVISTYNIYFIYITLLSCTANFFHRKRIIR